MMTANYQTFNNSNMGNSRYSRFLYFNRITQRKTTFCAVGFARRAFQSNSLFTGRWYAGRNPSYPETSAKAFADPRRISLLKHIALFRLVEPGREDAGISFIRAHGMR